jgi:hypothetical protein
MEIVGVALQSGRLHEEADKEDEAFRDQPPGAMVLTAVLAQIVTVM